MSVTATPTGVNASQIPSSRWLVTIVAALFVALPAVYGLRLWFDPSVAWLHPELLATSDYIWGLPEESVISRLSKAVDWKAFDPNVNRVRPVNDAAETIDAIARPYLTIIFGPHASMTPVAVFTAVLSPLFLFLALRRTGLSILAVAALVGLFLASTGFLSVIIAYIRPAKKITILTFCICLYLADRHARSRSTRSFAALVGVLFVSFFADEMDLVKYPVLALLFFPSLLWRTTWTKRAIFLSLPVLFLAVTAWGLPAFYARFSVHGAWDALADSKKFTVLGYLADPYFYVSFVAHLARSILTTTGISMHVPLTEGAALLALIGGTAVVVIRRIGAPATRWGMAASAMSLVGMAFYTTLLDWYPFPHEISYLGSFTYYYHSSLVVVVVVWLAYSWQALLQGTHDRRYAHQAALIGGLVACAIAITSNFAMFHQVNLLVQYIHLYPFSEPEIYRELRASQHGLLHPETLTTHVRLTFRKDNGRMARQYDNAARALLGSQWQESNFHLLFELFKKTPIMLDEKLNSVVKAYYPLATYEVRIR